MARLDVSPDPAGNGYLLDVQADALNRYTTRVVVPLRYVDDAPEPAERLNPVFRIAGDDVVMMTQWLSAVPAGMLGPSVTNLADQHTEVIAAIDFLIQGF